VVVYFQSAADGKLTSVNAVRWGPNGSGLYPYSPQFQWWKIQGVTTNVQERFSSFTVEVIDNGQPTRYDNGGDGFPLEMDIVPQSASSCATHSFTSGDKLNLTVAVSLPVTMSLFCRGAEELRDRCETVHLSTPSP